MNDFKSKLPDFQELSRFASKLFKDVKQSVDEIITEYKQKRKPEVNEPASTTVNPSATTSAPIPPTPPSSITPEAPKAAPTPPTPAVTPSTPTEKQTHTPTIIEVHPTHDAKNDPH